MSKYDYEVGIRYTVKNLRERVKTIEEGIEKKAYRGKKLETAKKHLTHFRYHLYWLQVENKKKASKKKTVTKRKARAA